VLVVAYIRVATWLQTSYRQTFRIRVALLQAVLRQEIGWFDTHDAGELGSRLAESVLTVLLSCLLLLGAQTLLLISKETLKYVIHLAIKQCATFKLATNDKNVFLLQKNLSYLII